MRTSSTFYVLFLLSFGKVANAFMAPSVARPSTISSISSGTVSRSSQLFVTSIESTGTTAPDAINPSSIKLDLPKNALPFREDAEKKEALMEVEVAIGRIAMVAALVFFAVEITTDTSIPEQIQQFATVAMLS